MIPFVDIAIALKWLIALYLCGVLGTLLFVNNGRLATLRYSLGKAVGIIGVAAITWVLSLFKIMSFNATTIIIVLAVSYTLVIFFRYKKIIESFKNNWRVYLFIEIVFVLLFVIGIAIRSTIPKAEGVEKFMDVAILSNLMRHGLGVPVDTWYAPNTINYYYFGHWIIALIAKMSSTTIGYAFNLGFASSLAITGTTIFCLGWQLSKKYIGGALALFLALFASNLHPFVWLILGRHNYFFFNSGRFIEQVINEYPLYSIILGDLHAHMLSLMIVTAVCASLALLLLDSNYRMRMVYACTAGILTGLLAATNSFDVITGGLVFGLALIWLLWRKKINFKQVVILGVIFTVVFAIILEIFMMHFKPAVGGIAIDVFKTPLLHVFWQFGILLLLLIISSIVLFKRKLSYAIQKKAEIALIFAAAGLILVLLPQFIYFKDIYHYQNPPFARANTVFKLWYAAWPLLALATAVVSTLLVNELKKKRQRIYSWLAVFMGCIILSIGTFIGITTLKDNLPNTINGIYYLQNNESQKLNVINWVAENIKNQPIVAQAPGESYSQQSWLSSYTGTSSIIGWKSHEWGWRYSQDEWANIGKRTDALKLLYESTTPANLRQMVSMLGVDYVLVGPDEKAAYAINGEQFINTFGSPIYSNSDYQIYSSK